VKQAADVCTRPNQRAMTELLRSGQHRHLEVVRHACKPASPDAALAALKRYASGKWSWTTPMGN